MSSPAGQDDLETVWKALADPTRREILSALRERPMKVGEVASLFTMSRYGVMTHLKVLKNAGLVLVEARGRERWNRLNPLPIRAVTRPFLNRLDEQNSDRLLRLKERVEASPPTREKAMDQEAAGVLDLVVEVVIKAPRDAVWKGLVEDTASWWREDFQTSARTKGFHIEPRLLGRMYEDWGDGEGQLWGQVHGLEAPSYLHVVGDSSREWGGPARNIMTWRLEEVADGTRLRLEHSLVGRISEATRASLEGGWKQLFGETFKEWVEARS